MIDHRVRYQVRTSCKDLTEWRSLGRWRGDYYRKDMEPFELCGVYVG